MSCRQLEKMETHQVPTPRSDDVTPAQSTHSRFSFSAGLARIIDRERPSYRQLAEKVAADEQLKLAMKTRSDPLQTSPVMIDAGVQSDHAVDLLAAKQCSEEMREETEAVMVPEKEDKGTAIDYDWLMATEAEDIVEERADGVEQAILDDAGTSITSSPSELQDENTEEQKEQDEEEDDHNIIMSSSAARQHKVHWGAISVDEFKLLTPSPVEERSKNYADELLLPAPWVSQASVTRLGLADLKRHKAVLVRSDEHMVIMETEEQSLDQPAMIADQSPCDGVNIEGLLSHRHHSSSSSSSSKSLSNSFI